MLACNYSLKVSTQSPAVLQLASKLGSKSAGGCLLHEQVRRRRADLNKVQQQVYSKEGAKDNENDGLKFPVHYKTRIVGHPNILFSEIMDSLFLHLMHRNDTNPMAVS